MGCCPSASNIFKEEFQLVPLTQFQLSGVSKNGDLHKILISVYNAQKQARLFDRQEYILHDWDVYIRHMTYAKNIMESALYSPSFAHFNVVPTTRRLGYHDEATQQHFSGHLRLVHLVVDNTLRGLREFDLLDQAVTLYCLGRYHIEKGVEIEELQTFCSSATDMIREVNHVRGCTLHSSDIKFFNAFFKFITDCIILGMNKQVLANQYMNMLVEKSGNCVGRRRLERKCVTTRAKNSWKRIAKQILSK